MNAIAAQFPYPWTARFQDGTELRQFDEDGTQHRLADLQARAAEIDFLKVPVGERTLVLCLPRGAVPSIFHRRSLTTSADGTHQPGADAWYFGWRLTKADGSVEKEFIVIHTDGTVETVFEDGRP